MFACNETSINDVNKGNDPQKDINQLDTLKAKLSYFLDTPLKDSLIAYCAYVEREVRISKSSLLFNVTFSKENDDTLVSYLASKYMVNIMDSNINIKSVFKEDSILFIIRDETPRLGSNHYKVKNDMKLLNPYELSGEGDLVHDLSPPLPWTFRMKNNQLIKEE